MPMFQELRSKLGSQYTKSDTIFTNDQRYSSSIKSSFSQDLSSRPTSLNTNDDGSNHTKSSSLSKLKRRTKLFLHIKSNDKANSINNDMSINPVSSTDYVDPGTDQTLTSKSNIESSNDNDKITRIDQPQDKSLKDKIVNKAKKLTSDIIHPVEAAKSKVTENITSNFSSLNKDPFQVTNAHIDFANLADDCSVGEHDEKLAGLNKEQERLLVAWTTERHLSEVRVVNEERRIWPTLNIHRSLSMEERMGQYAGYIGRFTLFLMQRCTSVYTSPWEDIPDFEEPIMRSHIERIIIGSAPWQESLMHARRVYRWENPKETFKWLGIYFVLWYFQYIISFLYATIIYKTIMNKWRPPTSKNIRTSINRVRTHGETAYRLGELIERHGQDEWLKKTTEEVGPWVQLQTGDVANLLEVLRNFYEWRSPQSTVYTLFFFLVCFFMGVLTDLQYCFRVVTFLAGMYFFVCFPVASRYPRYRLLVSPIKWTFWGVPTHAEYSCLILAQEGNKKNNQLERENTDLGDNDDGSSDVYSTPHQSTSDLPSAATPLSNSKTSTSHSSTAIAAFPCLYLKHPGQLIITQSGISFTSTIRKNTMLSHPWRDIRALKKDTASIPKMFAKMTAKVGDLDELTIFVVDEEDEVYEGEGEESVRRRGSITGEEKELKLDAVQRRDEAFNRIIAFSKLRWQGRI